MGLFKRGQADVRVLLTYDSYIATFLIPSQLTPEKLRTDKLKDLVFDKADRENLERLSRLCNEIYDGSIRNPLIEPKQLQEYFERLEKFVQELYDRGFNQELTRHFSLSDFTKELIHYGPNNTYLWLRACFKRGVKPYAIFVASLKSLAKKNNEEVLKLLTEFDIHVQTQSLEKYPEEWIASLLERQKIVIGHDDPIDKINFSLLPFLIREATTLRALLERPGTNGVYYQELLEFSKKYGQRLCEMIPDFVSFPVDTRLTPELVKKFHYFFAQKTKKVIVKPNYSAASGRGRAPYLILDTDDPNAPTNWYLQLLKYQNTYREIAKKANAERKSAMMIQCMLVEHDRLHPFVNEFTEHLHLAAHKHNVVGDAVWNYGIKYILLSRKEHWERTESKDMNIIEVSKTTTSDLTHKKDDLQMVGEFLNLVSPMGCHALDIVFGKFKNDAATKLFLLEANSGAVRADILGTNYYTKNDVMQHYLAWALDHFHGDKDAAGKYSRRLFTELEPEAKREFIKSLHDLWTFVNNILERYLFFCSHDGHLVCSKASLIQEHEEQDKKQQDQQLQL